MTWAVEGAFCGYAAGAAVSRKVSQDLLRCASLQWLLAGARVAPWRPPETGEAGRGATAAVLVLGRLGSSRLGRNGSRMSRQFVVAARNGRIRLRIAPCRGIRSRLAATRMHDCFLGHCKS